MVWDLPQVPGARELLKIADEDRRVKARDKVGAFFASEGARQVKRGEIDVSAVFERATRRAETLRAARKTEALKNMTLD